MGCRTRAPSTDLIRVRRSAGALELGAGPGRGAWICAKEPGRCLQMAIRRRSLSRALRREIGPGELEALRARLEAGRRPTRARGQDATSECTREDETRPGLGTREPDSEN